MLSIFNGNATNQPGGVTTNVYVNHINLGSTNYFQQIWTNETNPRYFYRAKTAGTWGSWKQNDDWNNLTNKPSTFTPSAHSHVAGDLPNASTSAMGIVQLNSAINSTSTVLAATSLAVKTVADALPTNKITVSSTQPSSPATNDIWIQI